MTDVISYQIQISGCVPGDGLCPFLYRSAQEYKLSYYIKQQDKSIMFVVSGKKENIKIILKALSNFNNTNIERILFVKKRADKSRNTFIPENNKV